MSYSFVPTLLTKVITMQEILAQMIKEVSYGFSLDTVLDNLTYSFELTEDQVKELKDAYALYQGMDNQIQVGCESGLCPVPGSETVAVEKEEEDEDEDEEEDEDEYEG